MFITNKLNRLKYCSFDSLKSIIKHKKSSIETGEHKHIHKKDAINLQFYFHILF